MYSRLRPVLFVLLLAAAAVAASVHLFGGRGTAWVTDVPALPGPWDVQAAGGPSEPTERFRLQLGSEGRYSIAVRSTAGGFVTTECGRWQSTDGRWQMRVTEGRAVGDATPLLLEQPGLRLGHFEQAPTAENPDRAVLVVRSAQRGAGLQRWTLHRAQDPLDVRECGPAGAP